MIRHTFTVEDVAAFASLSGDFNPVHVDVVAARRSLFGAAVVHGAYLALWSTKVLEADRVAGRRLSSLQATFRQCVGLSVDRSEGWTRPSGLEFQGRSFSSIALLTC